MNQFAQETTRSLAERLIDEFGDDVYKIAYLYVKDKQLAEDVFQDVFYKVIKHYPKFKHESTEKTWITRITINTCKDMLRSSWLRRVTLTDTYHETPSHIEQPIDIVKKEQYRELYEAVYQLPTKYKEVLILYYFKEYTYDEISNILNVPIGTVQSRLSRSKLKLKKVLGEEVREVY